MPYVFSGCTVADAPAIARNNVAAFWEDPHFRFDWAHRTLEEHIDCQAKRLPRTLLFKPTTKRNQKAVDSETGNFLGYARWNLPPQYAVRTDGTLVWPEASVPTVSAEEEARLLQIADAAIWDPRSDVEDLEVELRQAKKEILARKDYMRLDYLAVHPESKGRGIATALVQNGMREAERLGLDVFIHAMEAGLRVYKRLGFRIEREFILNNSMLGGPGHYSVFFMIYEFTTVTERSDT